MELASWFKQDTEDYPILGIKSFDTFLKICSHFSEWALDDIGLATRADAYKIWICPVKTDKIKEVKDVIERYTSMKLLLKYYNQNIVENKPVSFYIKLDWEQNKWILSYGITNNKNLYKVGEFEYTIDLELPETPILKYILNDLDDFNPREHLILYKMRQDAFSFNPGFCQITDPVLIDKKVIITTYNLGVWNNDILQSGEADKYLEVFKNWVKEQKWWNLVKLIVRPKNNGIMDFILEFK